MIVTILWFYIESPWTSVQYCQHPLLPDNFPRKLFLSNDCLKLIFLISQILPFLFYSNIFNSAILFKSSCIVLLFDLHFYLGLPKTTSSILDSSRVTRTLTYAWLCSICIEILGSSHDLRVSSISPQSILQIWRTTVSGFIYWLLLDNSCFKSANVWLMCTFCWHLSWKY